MCGLGAHMSTPLEPTLTGSSYPLKGAADFCSAAPPVLPAKLSLTRGPGELTWGRRPVGVGHGRGRGPSRGYVWLARLKFNSHPIDSLKYMEY
jgi:hypothetical protein